ncbi:pisatin demethylase [Apiospora phragmitis]|uniref:Pisatin demethylase n=1 Tax=Apiospora phragmitis TaxID=2905665 RepID=A0ABR1ULZ4_9PEZI
MNTVRSPYSKTGWFYRPTRHRREVGHVFSEMDEEKHMDLRQRMASGLFRSSYISTETLAKPVDFSKKVQYLSLDIISDINWGRPFGNLKRDRDVDDIVHSSEEGIWFFNFMLGTGLYRILHQPLIARWVGVSVKDSTGFGRLLGNARDIIRERLQRDAAHDKRSDMIASFFRHGLTEDQILSETTLEMVAGADTTASAIAIILLYLMTHPRVYAKLPSEIDTFRPQNNKMSSAGDGVISDADARKLPYLQAVIKEPMRVYFPIPHPRTEVSM